MANYLIAVGGTGQHIALAVADFVALAHEIFDSPDDFPSVHLILVDADQAADTEQPSAWQEARARLSALGLLTGDSFECVPLPVSSQLAGSRRMYEFVNRVGSSFGPNAADAVLMHEQREVDVTTGFYAQPRVGAMMAEWLFGEVTRGEAVNPQLARIFHLAGDPANRIVVAGSGVGGTGAGFAPALVRRLSSATGGAQLMALMATEWFRLGGACSSRLSESVQKSNANSALWHSAHSGASRVRTVLFGHPQVSRAPEEDCQSGAFQARKKNLTIPYYAAAAAMSFFAGEANGGPHVPAAALAGELVALPKTLPITRRVTLDALVSSNVEAVGRLTLAAEYLRGRYEGYVLPIASLSGRIRAFDATQPQLLEGPLKAKRAALHNLGVSDEKLPVAPRYHRGLATLRGWVNGRVDRPRDLWQLSKVVPETTAEGKAAGVAQDSASAALLIRRINFAGRVTGGDIVPVTDAQLSELVTLDDVDVSKVPASDAVTLTLRDLFDNWEARNSDQKRELAKALIDDGQIRRPVLVHGDKGDRPREWLTRWLLLTSLLAEGKLTIEDKPLPFTTGRVLTFRGLPVGELSNEFVCVPLINDHWNDEATITALWNAGSRAQSIATWCRNTAAVALCRASKLPSWLEVVNFAASRYATAAKQYTTQRVPVQWTGDVGTISLPLPNAASNDNDNANCVAATAEAFGVMVQRPEESGMSPAVRDVVREISERAVEVPSLNGGATTHIVFSELLSPAASNCLFGEVIVDTGAGNVWRLDSNSRIVTSVVGELLTENVGCFRSEARTTWLTPLRRAYIPLVTSGAMTIRADEHGQELRVTLTLRERTFMQTYSASRARAINPLLLHWPRSVASRSASLSLLYDVQERRFGPQAVHVVMHDAAVRNWSLSPLLGQRHSLHYVDTDGRVPHSLSFELERQDVGFLGISRTVHALPAERQQVAVDFGTSATVVAVRREGGVEVLDLLATGADATSEVWKGSELSAFQWFGTRSLDASIRDKKRAPSALVYLGSATEARPAQPGFGDHVLLDQDDWRWNDAEASLLYDIKWTREGAYRETYLLHHLEQCLAAALNKKILTSRNLEMTFTMPLRQRARAKDFVDEVEGVIAKLEQRTGFSIDPRFAYESIVIAPEDAPRADIDAMVIADLGGGTLDLFARYFGAERRNGASSEVFESARLGGHALVEWLTRELDGGRLAEYRRRLRIGSAEQLDQESARVAASYFDVIKRFTALWMDSVWRYWTGNDRAGRVHVQLLGKGWSLPSSPGEQMAVHLSDIAQAVGSNLTYTRYEDAILPPDPKELLARRTVLRDGATKNAFMSFEPAAVNGLEVTVAGDVRRDDEPLRGLGANTPAIAIAPAGLERIRKLTGAREEVVATVRDATRLTLGKRSTGVEKHDGAVIEGPNVWAASPLAIAAEMYTHQVLLHVNS